MVARIIKLFFVVGIVAGAMIFFIPVTAHQASPNRANYTADNSAFAAADYGSGYSARATTNGRSFSLVAPAFFGSLGLGGRAGEQDEGKQEQKK